MPQRSPDYQTGQAVPGTVYRVHRVLGAGGMGTVYDVEDTSVGKRYVLKTLHGDLADRTDLAARLAREARALAKLQHPNIVEVYTSGTTQDSLRLPYYVMERLQGQSLRTVLERKGRLTMEQACDIGIDLLDALDHAHEFGIIHRDVKPDNIFITRGRDGRSLAKLLDFGIIKLAASTGSNTMHTGGRFIGTFRYAPPEQILGREVTPRSDLYAAGLVIYEMVAGRGPFDDFTGEMEIGKAHIDVAAPELSRFASVHPVLGQLVMSSLQKDPALRPRDAFSFASALRDFKKLLAGGAPFESSTKAATVEQVVAQPSSSARPAMPFGAQPSHADIVPPSGPATRIDAPAGMHAATAAAPNSGRTNTVSLGVLPLGALPPASAVETYAASPLQMTSGEAPMAMQYAQPHMPIDRRAETREAAPQALVRPSYDTAPIPLAILAPHDSIAKRSAETLGAHTTEASQRKKSQRSAFVVIAVVLVALGACAIGTFVVWRTHRAATTSTPPTSTQTAAVDVISPTSAAATDTTTLVPATSASVIATTQASTAAAVDATPKHPAASTTHTATATTTHATSSANLNLIATPPVTTNATATATATATTRHRPGSGL